MASKVFDMATDPLTGDVLISGGDFSIMESTEQHMSDLLAAEKGEYKATPLTGVGLQGFLLDDHLYSDDLKALIMKEFEEDGIILKSVNMDSIDKMKVIGSYEAN